MFADVKVPGVVPLYACADCLHFDKHCSMLFGPKDTHVWLQLKELVRPRFQKEGIRRQGCLHDEVREAEPPGSEGAIFDAVTTARDVGW
jgi:hypothetical protein